MNKQVTSEGKEVKEGGDDYCVVLNARKTCQVRGIAILGQIQTKKTRRWLYYRYLEVLLGHGRVIA